MPRWVKILLGLVAGFGVFVGAIVAVVFWATAGLIEPIDRQIAALKAGDMAAAYAETSQAFRQATPLESFVSFVDIYPILKDVASRSFSSRSFKNELGSVEGTLTSSSGGVVPVTYQLVKEQGAWKIMHIKLDAPAGVSG